MLTSLKNGHRFGLRFQLRHEAYTTQAAFTKYETRIIPHSSAPTHMPNLKPIDFFLTWPTPKLGLVHSGVSPEQFECMEARIACQP